MNYPEKPLLCLTEIMWREFGEKDTTDASWACSSTCPVEGEMRFASVKKVDMEVGQRCWLLFEPAFALLNGFDQDDNPQELDVCAVVEVEIVNITPHYRRVFDSRGQDNVWLECRCLQVVPWAHIPDVFPPIPTTTKRAHNLTATTGRTVTYFLESFHEFHNWFVVTNPAATRHALPHIVLIGTSDPGYCLICNWVVECNKTSWKAA